MITIKNIIKQQVKQILQKKYLVDFDFQISYPPAVEMGDYSCNAPMVLAAILKKNPIEIGKEIIKSVTPTFRSEIDKIEIVKPGFINFYLSEKFLQENLKKILKENLPHRQAREKRQRIQVEFISANPTGPLTLANGRGGFSGDVLANVLTLAGQEVEREYYINDYGNQVRILGHSVLKDELAQYKGKYIEELANKLSGTKIDKKDIDAIGLLAANEIMKKYIKPVIKKAGVKFDEFFSEKYLHESGKVEKMLNFLKEKNLVEEKDGAVWLKTAGQQEGDDKNRVLVKSNGEKTYFLADIAYHFNKFHERKFGKVINLWGADHHGYVPRMKQAMALLGYPGRLEILLIQMVRLIKNGKEFRMSKRAGVYVTLEKLIEMVGLDVTRFFFLMHSNNKAMDFDLDLAKEKSNKNPVFYVQYAHARICSILKKASAVKKELTHDFNRGLQEQEATLIKELIKWPEVIEEVAENYEVHKIPFYAIALADKFHDFYENCRVIEENNLVNEFRLDLIKATKQILKNVLNTLGVSAPEKM